MAEEEALTIIKTTGSISLPGGMITPLIIGLGMTIGAIGGSRIEIIMPLNKITRSRQVFLLLHSTVNRSFKRADYSLKN